VSTVEEAVEHGADHGRIVQQLTPVLHGTVLRNTNVIERCFVEVRRRTRPMVCFVNVETVGRIIHAIFNGLNDQWHHRTLRITGSLPSRMTLCA
jgi:transposase-like protein